MDKPLGAGLTRPRQLQQQPPGGLQELVARAEGLGVAPAVQLDELWHATPQGLAGLLAKVTSGERVLRASVKVGRAGACAGSISLTLFHTPGREDRQGARPWRPGRGLAGERHAAMDPAEGGRRAPSQRWRRGRGGQRRWRRRRERQKEEAQGEEGEAGRGRGGRAAGRVTVVSWAAGSWRFLFDVRETRVAVMFVTGGGKNGASGDPVGCRPQHRSLLFTVSTHLLLLLLLLLGSHGRLQTPAPHRLFLWLLFPEGSPAQTEDRRR